MKDKSLLEIFSDEENFANKSQNKTQEMNINTPQPPHRPVGQYPRLTVTVFVKGNDKT